VYRIPPFAKTREGWGTRHLRDFDQEFEHGSFRSPEVIFAVVVGFSIKHSHQRGIKLVYRFPAG
jgi:hypothetical protein